MYSSSSNVTSLEIIHRIFSNHGFTPKEPKQIRKILIEQSPDFSKSIKMLNWSILSGIQKSPVVHKNERSD